MSTLRHKSSWEIPRVSLRASIFCIISMFETIVCVNPANIAIKGNNSFSMGEINMLQYLTIINLIINIMVNVYFLTRCNYVLLYTIHPPSYPIDISLSRTKPAQTIPASYLIWLSFALVAVLALVWNCFWGVDIDGIGLLFLGQSEDVGGYISESQCVAVT